MIAADKMQANTTYYPLAFPHDQLSIATCSRISNSMNYSTENENYRVGKWIFAISTALQDYGSTYFTGPNYFAYRWIALGY